MGRQTVVAQSREEGLERDARFDSRLATRDIDIDDLVEPFEGNKAVVGLDQRGRRMAGPDGADLAATVDRATNQADDLTLVAGPVQAAGPEPQTPGPVLPSDAGRFDGFIAGHAKRTVRDAERSFLARSRRQLGAKNYLIKPFTEAQLQARVARLLRAPALQTAAPGS